MARRSAGLTVVLALAMMAVPGAAYARTAIAGTIKSKEGKPLPGIVLLEKGEIHNNKWHRGVLVDSSGRFTIELSDAGSYGVHVYASGYIYSPNPVRVEAGKTAEVPAVLVREPTRDNDPRIRQIGFFPVEAQQGKVAVKMDVSDPNDDLGPQVMAFNAATGHVYAMRPPKPVRNLKANFPQGVYQIEVDTARERIDPASWYFVVADHKCNTTDIIHFPKATKLPAVFEPK
jgi:hypothetical protein